MRYFLSFLFQFLLFLQGAHASEILLNTNGSGTPQTVGLTFGTYGQGVSVGTDTTLTQIGIWVGNPARGTAEFEIWNGSNTTLLFSETQMVDPASGTELLLSMPFTFNLMAGNTYYFDVIGPYSSSGDQQLGFIAGTAAETQDNLTPVWPNSVYLGPTQPAGFAQGSFTLPLELIGTQGAANVAEPGTVGLMALVCAALAIGRRSAAG